MVRTVIVLGVSALAFASACTPPPTTTSPAMTSPSPSDQVPKIFLNPKMQRDFEEASKTRDVNVSSAYYRYSSLRRLLAHLKTKDPDQVVPFAENEDTKPVLKALDITSVSRTNIPNGGYRTTAQAAGKKWSTLAPGEAVMTFYDGSNWYAIDKDGIEIEAYTPPPD